MKEYEKNFYGWRTQRIAYNLMVCLTTLCIHICNIQLMYVQWTHFFGSFFFLLWSMQFSSAFYIIILSDCKLWVVSVSVNGCHTSSREFFIILFVFVPIFLLLVIFFYFGSLFCIVWWGSSIAKEDMLNRKKTLIEEPKHKITTATAISTNNLPKTIKYCIWTQRMWKKASEMSPCVKYPGRAKPNSKWWI